jgi:hypothetical protein
VLSRCLVQKDEGFEKHYTFFYKTYHDKSLVPRLDWRDGALPMDRFLGLPSWWLPTAAALIVSAVAFPLPKTKKNSGQPESGNSDYPLTFAARNKFILQVPIAPILICFLAFTRSVIYRVIYPVRTTTGQDCQALPNAITRHWMFMLAWP